MSVEEKACTGYGMRKSLRGQLRGEAPEECMSFFYEKGGASEVDVKPRFMVNVFVETGDELECVAC